MRGGRGDDASQGIFRNAPQPPLSPAQPFVLSPSNTSYYEILWAENYFSDIRIDLSFSCRMWVNPTRLWKGMAFQASNRRVAPGNWHALGRPFKPHKIIGKIKMCSFLWMILNYLVSSVWESLGLPLKDFQLTCEPFTVCTILFATYLFYQINT